MCFKLLHLQLIRLATNYFVIKINLKVFNQNKTKNKLKMNSNDFLIEINQSGELEGFIVSNENNNNNLLNETIYLPEFEGITPDYADIIYHQYPINTVDFEDSLDLEQMAIDFEMIVPMTIASLDNDQLNWHSTQVMTEERLEAYRQAILEIQRNNQNAAIAQRIKDVYAEENVQHVFDDGANAMKQQLMFWAFLFLLGLIVTIIAVYFSDINVNSGKPGL